MKKIFLCLFIVTLNQYLFGENIVYKDSVTCKIERAIEAQSKSEKFNLIALATLLGLLGNAAGWLYNERKKSKLKVLSEKEERYGKLIRNIRYLGIEQDLKKGNEFFEEFLLCWMYCPDEIIKKGNAYLDSMNRDMHKVIDQDNVNKLKGEFILELRKDLIGKTSLVPSDLRDVVFRDKTQPPRPTN